MMRLNIHQAKTHLSHYMNKVEAGETFLICRRNVPIAEVRPLPKQRKSKRPMGLGKGTAIVPPEFFDPLPDDLLDLFEGKGE